MIIVYEVSITLKSADKLYYVTLSIDEVLPAEIIPRKYIYLARLFVVYLSFT